MKNLIVVLLLIGTQAIKAYEKRDILQKSSDTLKVKKALIANRQWVTYPAYSDRKAWDTLTGAAKEYLIKCGEEALDYQWQVVKATDYIEFERSGSRAHMQKPFEANNKAMANLVLAELAEGKGRFIDQVINGAWNSCEMTSWALSAHLRVQQSHRSLPEHTEHIIDLTSGDLGAFLAWTLYFFEAEFNKVNPAIADRIRYEIGERILKPYMQRSDFWWQAFNLKEGGLVNNWNPWCNFNVLTCFLLLEEDKDLLSKAVWRTMKSVDHFINYNKSDGACEEGPSYWGHAAGKMYDYLQLLSYATGGSISVFDKPMIVNMGEYIAQSYVGNGWVVNFADASAKGGGEPGVIYRYGKAVNSDLMKQFAAYLNQRDADKKHESKGLDIFRNLESLSSNKALETEKIAVSKASAVWYPETEFCYMRSKTGLMFAAKGGYNNESHNHNDVGTFSLYVDNIPVIIDAGVGTYTRQTFSHERYSIWTMQSNYHNLPLINGHAQKYGSQYRSKDVHFNKKNKSFSLDISGAYPKEAKVSSWNRKYQLKKNGLLITDQFQMQGAADVNTLNFMTYAKPDISEKGVVRLTQKHKPVVLTYDASQFDASIEAIELSDPKLVKVWGKTIYRLTLTAKENQNRGTYRLEIDRAV